MGEEQLKDSLQGADIVVIPAGVPRKPGAGEDATRPVRVGGAMLSKADKLSKKMSMV